MLDGGACLPHIPKLGLEFSNVKPIMLVLEVISILLEKKSRFGEGGKTMFARFG
jgi:hypothetical protein